MVEAFGTRVATLDSEALMADPARSMTALSGVFGVPLDIAAVIAGPAFTTHSKFGSDFDGAARDAEVRAAADIHADEIEKVAVWAEAVAQTAGRSFALGANLLK